MHIRRTALIFGAVIAGGIASWPSDAVGTEQSPFLPTPEDAHLCLVTEDWLLWETNSMVKGTGGMRAPLFAHQYFLQSDVYSPASPIFSCAGTRPPGTLGILTNGTAVFCFSGFTADLVLVDRQGRRTQLSCQEPQQSGIECDWPLAAYDDGVLVRPSISNDRSPVYFVPWKSPPQNLTQPVALDFMGKIMVTDSNGVSSRGRREFYREGNTFVWAWEDWDNGHLSFFDLKDRTRKIHPNSREATPFCRTTTLPATDGDTAVLVVNSEGRGQCVTGFDVRTGKRLPAWLSNGYVVVAVKHRIAYALTRIRYDDKKGEWSYALAACDLMSVEPKPKILLETGFLRSSPETCIIARKDALTLWWEHEWKHINWETPAR